MYCVYYWIPMANRLTHQATGRTSLGQKEGFFTGTTEWDSFSAYSLETVCKPKHFYPQVIICWENFRFFPFPIITLTRLATNMAESVTAEEETESLGHMLRSGRVESLDKPVFSILKILRTDFQSDCTSLQFHQPWMRGSFSHILVSVCC